MPVSENKDHGKALFMGMMGGIVRMHFADALAADVGARGDAIVKAMDKVTELIWQAGTTAAQQRIEQFSDAELMAELRRRALASVGGEPEAT